MPDSAIQQPFVDNLDSLIEMRPFPAVASQLVAACDSDEVSAGEVGEIIAVDPTLSLRLMQIANSPLYGYAGRITSVSQAVVIVGLRALKNLAVSVAMAGMYDDGPGRSAKSRQQLWSHSMACGSFARTLALQTGLTPPDEAFLAGVVHDVGKLLFTDHAPEEYASVLSDCQTTSSLNRELEAFGIAHTSVGQTCGENWGLPDEITDAICFHHDPEQADFGGDLVNIVWAANRLTRIWDAGSAQDQHETPESILTDLGVENASNVICDLHDRAMAELAAIRDAYQFS